MKYLQIVPDLLIIAGLSGIWFGLYMKSPWMAYTVTGALVFGVGLVMSWPRKEK